MTLLHLAVPALLAALLAYALTPLARTLAIRAGAIDEPGTRKIHVVATPRLGGLAVLFAVCAVYVALSWFATGVRMLSPSLLLGVATGLIPVAVVSLVDDIRPQRAIVKFGVHLAGATIAVALGVRLNPSIRFLGQQLWIGWLAIPISILWLAGITNAFNLIDGLDGLSAGLALISSLSLAAVSIVTRHNDMAIAALILAGALVGFLPYNIYPAKIYLGDVGATTIGFFLGALTLSGGSTTSSGLAVTLPVVVLGVPVADTLLSMLRRFVKRTGKRGIFAADRNHIHHRLLALGLDHRRAVLVLYSVGLLLAAASFASLFMTHQNAALLLGVLLVAAVVGISKLGYDEFAIVRSGAVLKVYQAPVMKKAFFVVFVDLTMIVSALYVATGLKYDDWGMRLQKEAVVDFAALIAAVTLTLFVALRIYRRAWSSASIDDVMKLSTAVVAGSFASYVIAQFMLPSPPVATFLVTYTLVMLAIANGGRASYRVLSHWNRQSNRDGEPVVIYGAGVGGTLALREILSNNDVPMKPVGFLDDDPRKIGGFVNGYPVLGSLEDLAGMVGDGTARGVVIASSKIPIAKVRAARETCKTHGAWTRVFSVGFRSVDLAGQPAERAS